MTALKRYARLESPGLWRPDPDAQRRDVVVSFGEASLVIADRAGRPLTHWSLAAVARAESDGPGALYVPSAEATETLELDDDTMVEAIETVRAALLRARPRRGRLRLIATAALTAGAVLLGALWLPDALVRHAVGVVPAPARAEIGDRLLSAIVRVSGPPCRSARGDRALATLEARLLGPEGRGLRVLPGGIDAALALPGGLILLERGLVELHDSAEVAAGHVLAASERRMAEDPLGRLLAAAGPAATLRLLTTGQLPAGTLERHAETLVGATPPPVPADRLLARFAAAGVPSTPYARALDATGEAVLALIEADPMRGRAVRPLLPDGDWVALQGICGG